MIAVASADEPKPRGPEARRRTRPGSSGPGRWSRPNTTTPTFKFPDGYKVTKLITHPDPLRHDDLRREGRLRRPGRLGTLLARRATSTPRPPTSAPAKTSPRCAASPRPSPASRGQHLAALRPDDQRHERRRGLRAIPRREVGRRPRRHPPASPRPSLRGRPMLRFLGQGSRLCDGRTRREILRVGGLGVLVGSGLEPA